MPADQLQPGDNQYPIKRFKGLNERLRFINPDASELDILEGFIQQRAGAIQRPNGIRLLQYLQGLRIISLAQTFDTRQNVIIQTDQGVRLYSEDEIMGRPSSAVLTPVVLPEEETMSRALLYHTEASSVAGGAIAVANTWTTAPLNQLIEQVNPDGSPAAFVTNLGAPANHFTLAAGTYRFKGKCLQCDNSSAAIAKARLFNVTTGLPAWNGLQHEESTSGNGPQDRNITLFFEGTLVLAVPTQFRIEQWSSTVANVNGFGTPATTGKPEVYRQLEILKTA